MPNYGDPKYWEKRYKEQEGTTFDWLEDYVALKQTIEDICPKDGKVLILGCGNAEFSEDMYNDGYENIVNIDISTVVIQQMKERCAQLDSMTWEVMDVRSLEFPDNTFDLAIDKSTIDALLCGDNSFFNVALMTKEIQRVLKLGGHYFAISYGTPDNRLCHFNWGHLSWEVKHTLVGNESEGSSPHYGYICKKLEGWEQAVAQNWDSVAEELREIDEEDAQLAGGDDDEDAPETTEQTLQLNQIYRQYD